MELAAYHLTELSRFYGVSPRDFYRDEPLLPDDARLGFRAELDADTDTLRNHLRRERARLVNVARIRRRLKGTSPPEVPGSLVTDKRAEGEKTDVADEGREKAREVRDYLSQSRDPIDDLQTVLYQRLNVLCSIRSLPEGSSAAFIGHPETPPVVIIDTDQPRWRQRFSIAHELAHLLFRDSEGRRFRNMKRDSRSLEETRADAFAAEFLLPQQALREREGSFSDPRAIGKLIADFGASAQSALYHLQNAGFLTKGERKRLERREAEIKRHAAMRADWPQISEREGSLEIWIEQTLEEARENEAISRGKQRELIRWSWDGDPADQRAEA